MTIQDLASMIDSHGFPAWVKDGKLFAQDCWREDDGTVKTATVELPATLQAVRDWLGY